MATTLADIITQIRQRSDMENNEFVSDIELKAWTNNSLGGLDDILVTTYDDYKMTSFQSVLSGGANNVIPIPSNFYKLRGVDFCNQSDSASPDKWTTIYGFQFTERNRNNQNLTSIALPYTNSNISARLTDAGIIIQPADYAQGKYQIWYVPKFIPLVEDTDTLTIQMDTQAWVEYAVVDVCIKILNKQNLDPSGFMMEKQELKQRIIAAAKNRDSSGPKRVANVRFQGYDSLYPYGWEY